MSVKIKIIIAFAYGPEVPLSVTKDEHDFLKRLQKLSNHVFGIIER